jgi:hypothetical protein
MSAADAEGGATRFEAARAAVRQMIDGLGGGSMALILVGPQPQVLAPVTTSPEVLHEALAAARPAPTPGDWEAAVALAAGAVRAGAADESVVVFVTDGGLPDGLPPLPAEARYVPVGQSGDNLAVQALALRPGPVSGGGAAGPELFASVANYGAAERAVILSLTRNGQLFAAQELVVLPGQTASLVRSGLPAEPAVYEAYLSPLPGAPDVLDPLPLDDRAWAVYQPPSGGRALVVTPGNLFLDQVLLALAEPMGLRSFRLKAGEAIPPEPFDLYVLDGPISGTLPAGDLLIIDPPPGDNGLFSVGGIFTNTAEPRLATADPLAARLDWTGVDVLQARQVALPDWARPLVEVDGGPLVFAGETQGRRVAVFTFDLHDSDLPLQVAFPVLMANLLDYLAPAQAFSAPAGLRPGEALTIRPRGDDEAIAIVAPDGTRYGAPATEAGVVFAHTEQLGIYQVVSAQRFVGAFAVNLFDPAESAITPAAQIIIGRNEVPASARDAAGEYEIWPWLAAAALLVLLGEWWLYHRGTTLPAVAGWRGIFVRRETRT